MNYRLTIVDNDQYWNMSLTLEGRMTREGICSHLEDFIERMFGSSGPVDQFVKLCREVVENDEENQVLLNTKDDTDWTNDVILSFGPTM